MDCYSEVITDKHEALSFCEAAPRALPLATKKPTANKEAKAAKQEGGLDVPVQASRLNSHKYK
jgi:hypothetical protein